MTDLQQSELGRADVELVEKSTIFQGFFSMLKFRLRHRLFRGGWSEEISRELFQRGEASAAVLYDAEHDLIGLVEQFRVGALDSEFGPWCLEVVAGMIEQHDSAETTIVKEIREEAGITELKLEPISEYYSTPGGCSEKIHLFCALCDLSEAGGIYGLDEEGEDIRFQVFKPDEVFAQMYRARTNNAATLIGLQWLQLNRQRLRAECQA
ncbi:NUDIX domain-containing protein [Agaribacterium haliotis]|uniref:NUDIX domain-containing protein n=1 Tax=Agaribacterium haliotis TaxID=2013869 RepID=UPI000BB54084|nr:NUDIX domain-containing protein [Agaribacterium haliotis]